MLISGSIGEHGVAVLSQRESLQFETTIHSDTAALHTNAAAHACEELLAAMRAHPLGRDTQAIGHVTRDPHHFVQMQTTLGGRRVVDWLSGEPLPRIC